MGYAHGDTEKKIEEFFTTHGTLLENKLRRRVKRIIIIKFPNYFYLLASVTYRYWLNPEVRY